MNYTSIEQSKKLLELGLSPKSADMWYAIVDNEPFICLEKREEYDNIPCWSLAALLDAMPSIDYSYTTWIPIVFKKNKYHCNYESRSYVTPMYYTESNSCIDAAFEMVCLLLENGYIKKGE